MYYRPYRKIVVIPQPTGASDGMRRSAFGVFSAHQYHRCPPPPAADRVLLRFPLGIPKHSGVLYEGVLLDLPDPGVPWSLPLEEKKD